MKLTDATKAEIRKAAHNEGHLAQGVAEHTIWLLENQRAEWFAEPERTPETVLRAMLAAYEAAWVARVDAVIAEGKSPLFDKRQAWLERAITQLRWEYMGAAARADYQPFVTGTEMRPDYDARLTGKLPLNAPPMEV